MPELQRALPKYLQIANYIRDQILRGDLRPGDEVPSERQIAADWDVARPTAARSLEALRQQGFVESRQGAGTFVRQQLHLNRLAVLVAPAGDDAQVTPAVPGQPRNGQAALRTVLHFRTQHLDNGIDQVTGDIVAAAVVTVVAEDPQRDAQLRSRKSRCALPGHRVQQVADQIT